MQMTVIKSWWHVRYVLPGLPTRLMKMQNADCDLNRLFNAVSSSIFLKDCMPIAKASLSPKSPCVNSYTDSACGIHALI